MHTFCAATTVLVKSCREGVSNRNSRSLAPCAPASEAEAEAEREEKERKRRTIKMKRTKGDCRSVILHVVEIDGGVEREREREDEWVSFSHENYTVGAMLGCGEDESSNGTRAGNPIPDE